LWVTYTIKVADGEDGLQILSIAPNILNSSRGQLTKNCPPTLGLGDGLITPYHRIPGGYKTSRSVSDLGASIGFCENFGFHKGQEVF
jgi:hypothetical protein